MQTSNRRSTPQVIHGRVHKKNNHALSTDYYYAPDPRTVIVDRKRPGSGYRHVLNKSDIYRFLDILPNWDELAVGLNAIVLAAESEGADGYHRPGVVHVCAWETDLWQVIPWYYYDDHRDIFDRLGVPCEEVEGGDYLCKFEENTVRGYQLLHILLHELGHHHDRITTRSQRKASRGEGYAEAYARQYEALIWQQYLKAFPL